MPGFPPRSSSSSHGSVSSVSSLVLAAVSARSGSCSGLWPHAVPYYCDRNAEEQMGTQRRNKHRGSLLPEYLLTVPDLSHEDPSVPLDLSITSEGNSGVEGSMGDRPYLRTLKSS